MSRTGLAETETVDVAAIAAGNARSSPKVAAAVSAVANFRQADFFERTAMHYKLMGFRQDGAIRRFCFSRVEIGVPPISINVLADTSLARTFKLSLQELPSLCSRLLNASDQSATGTLILSETDMSVYAAENAVAAAQIDAARLLRSRQSSLASMARKARA